MLAKQAISSSSRWDLKPLLETAEKKYFSADEVINAYLQGKKDQLRDIKKILAKTFEENLLRAKQESVRLFEKLNDDGISCERVFLKMKDVERFNAIFIIEEGQWCKPEFDKYYRNSQKVKNKVNSETFDFAIIFMPSSDYFDLESLHSDGYILSYGPVQ